MLITPRSRERLRSEEGMATLLTTMFITMFLIAFSFFALFPLVWTPQTRDEAIKTINSWTELYAEYGEVIPPYSSEYRRNAPHQNTVTFRLEEALNNNRFVTSVKQVVCGRVEAGATRAVLVPEAQHALGAQVACGADLNVQAAKWKTPGWMDRIFGDFWHISQPKPARSVR